MREQGSVAIIGAGIVGCAVAYALACENRRVVLIDRDEPGVGGASYGNAGHIAAEFVEPLPSLQLLLGFWRQLFELGGPLAIPARRLPHLMPWIAQFAAAAWRQKENSTHVAPLVRASVATLEKWLQRLGRAELLRRNGFYEIWLRHNGAQLAHERAQLMERLEIATAPAPAALVESARAAAHASTASALWYPDSAHVVDPLEVVRAFASGALGRGAQIRRAEVSAVRPRSAGGVEVMAGEQSLEADAAVVCAGPWSAALLEPLGLSAPLESVRGYHVELPQQAALADAPLVYAEGHVIITPMTGRLRASTYMEFLPPQAPADPRKFARLRGRLREYGYACAPDGPSWVGARPVLPDYLPGIGCAPGTSVFYAIGHHLIGLTISAVTAELVAALVARREPPYPVGAFDLQRFGPRRSAARATVSDSLA
jgi:D-hydroxyproline dehydrogenase